MQNHADTAVIAVSDDKRARKVCKEIEIECIGTLGLIELMKKNRIITKEKAIITVRAIEKTPLYVTKHLIDEVTTKIQNQEPQPYRLSPNPQHMRQHLKRLTPYISLSTFPLLSMKYTSRSSGSQGL